MTQLLQKVTSLASSKRGSKIVLAIWLVVVVFLSILAPSSKMVAINSNVSDLPSYVPSEQARTILEQHFPADGGATALFVFHAPSKLTAAEKQDIRAVSKWLAQDKPAGVASAVPLHQMPDAAWGAFLSADGTTLMIPVQLKKELDSHDVHEAVKKLDAHVHGAISSSLTFAITGPAGIASDAIGVFQHADVQLMIASVVLILILLVVLYRSPLLAVVPLAVAGVLYEVVDRVLGFAGKAGWFVVESQALSIMIILLFALLTDYCLFVFSRYKEELRVQENKYEAMRVTMTHVGEPIFFSSSIILVAVLTLAAAMFKPYQHFAPVFGSALVVILLGGITLIPATFSMLGRKAFWPFIPKFGDVVSTEKGWWHKTGRLVARKPRLIASLLSLVLVGASLFVFQMNISFNMLKSFPATSESRTGFETLEGHFAKGSLAPVTVLLESAGETKPDAELINSLAHLQTQMSQMPGVQAVTPSLEGAGQKGTLPALPAGMLSADHHAVQFQLVLADDPFSQAAMQTVERLRQTAPDLLVSNHLDQQFRSLSFAGQTPIQLDTHDVNKRDTTVVFVIVGCLLTILLIFQSRSLIAPIYMMLTILLTYGTSLGLSWIIFHNVMGVEAFSYRIPLYTFVFLVALGVDYNILLLSRIREEAQKRDLTSAISYAVGVTGKTISSAGLILMATFAVLMTQPLQELVVFGFVVSLGVLIDTFLVRGLLMPSIMVLLGKWNWWPKR